MTRAGKIETAIAITLAVVIGAVVGFLMSGEDRSHLFAQEDVDAITQSLDEAESLANAGDCFKALTPAGEAQQLAESLPADVDPALKRSLIDGVVTLTLRIGRQCTENTDTTGTTGPTGTTDDVEEEPETPTGETGPTATTDEETGTTDKETPKPNNKPTKPTPDPKPKPDPEVPTTPTPPTNVPPDEIPPDSGGISPNP